MEVAEASIRFAMENCPVEGVLTHDDGSSVSLDELQSLMENLQGHEGTFVAGSSLGVALAGQLRIVIDYASENCPVEGVTPFHDGRRISGRDIVALAEKLRHQS
ncbi:MAG TPA: hypothetical protein VKF39_02175 [Nitrososphaerales archaeon]|nr:hypothetical protein [Nitrososphaerales archaeon]